jgi:hypothetical protein
MSEHDGQIVISTTELHAILTEMLRSAIDEISPLSQQSANEIAAIAIEQFASSIENSRIDVSPENLSYVATSTVKSIAECGRSIAAKLRQSNV